METTLTNRYLRKSANNLFWICFLTIPYYLWFYSIITELNKHNLKFKKSHKIVLMFLFGFPISYLIVMVLLIITGNFNFDYIIPLNLASMICTLSLIIWSTRSISKFENQNNLKPIGKVALFFGFVYSIAGVWFIQPKLNEYEKLIE